MNIIKEGNEVYYVNGIYTVLAVDYPYVCIRNINTKKFAIVLARNCIIRENPIVAVTITRERITVNQHGGVNHECKFQRSQCS